MFSFSFVLGEEGLELTVYTCRNPCIYGNSNVSQYSMVFDKIQVIPHFYPMSSKLSSFIISNKSPIGHCKIELILQHIVQMAIRGCNVFL